jgi:hypothetical protein
MQRKDQSLKASTQTHENKHPAFQTPVILNALNP